MAIAKGTQVRQIVQIVEGTVEKFDVDQESGELQYLVSWVDADGTVHEKYFKDGEIEAVV